MKNPYGAKVMSHKALFSAVLFFMLLFFAAPVQCADYSFGNILDIMRQRHESIRDYQCIYHSYTARGSKIRDQKFKYYFKKQKLIRMELLTGMYGGAVLIHNPEKHPGKIRVQAGNPLVLMLQKTFLGEYFDLDSEWVTDLRGNGIHESDWGWYIEIHRRLLSSGSGRYVGEKQLNGVSVLFYELFSEDPEKTFSVKREEVWIDPVSYFPVKYIQYDKDGVIIRQAITEDLAFDTGVDEDLLVFGKGK
ncbi:MAG: outer membrane lipoprotein-sorting protein [Proteobacteria bacterium]|nr:outer membrane lipoprotein-sorting protein [Pseudomonadota bacterium]MBU1708511.1 outer membrane lipoprotein-sorting protein [Pseudomonadota bacterium]